jgi:hypothetical protein
LAFETIEAKHFFTSSSNRASLYNLKSSVIILIERSSDS